jgi:formylglycine-generating enzyme required for sulfatase activity
MKPYKSILISIITVAVAAACSPSDAAIETAIEKTSIFEASIATAIAQTQQAQVTPTLVQSPTPTLGVGSTMLSDVDNMLLVYVPEGPFLMGSADNDADADEDEQPQHRVNLDAFWIDQTEVTNAMFAGFLNSQGNQTEGGATWLDADDEQVLIELVGGEWLATSGYDNHPVVVITWYGAVAYCQWAGRRLPTEAEWEKAARGPDGSIYPWGDEFDSSLANVDDETRYDDYKVTCGPRGCDGFERSAPVGSFPDGVSLYGALDMAGNIWEWVADLFSEEYYDQSPVNNPIGPSSGDARSFRGGSWINTAKFIRSTNRGNDSPDLSANGLGFRCAWSKVAPMLVQVTPAPSPTHLPPTVTPEPPPVYATGAITGLLGYPSEWIPAMRIVAFERDGTNWYSTTTPIYASRYIIENVPPGTYFVVAYHLELDIIGGYTNFVTCGLYDYCTDHTLVDVMIYPSQTKEGIHIWDWGLPENSVPENPVP